MLKVARLSKSYGPRIALSAASFNLGGGQKAALVGPNGVGKSTLLKIIAGLENPDSGEVGLPKNACLGYLPQEIAVEGEETIEAYLRKVVGIAEIGRRLKALETQLESKEKLEEYGELQQTYAKLEGYAFEHRMKAALAGFGFGENEIDKPVSLLSGGQKSKVALAGILLKGVDILLLDEPTNNLDLPALLWLEHFLAQSKATAIIVSHDRRFLDRVVSKVIEIDWWKHDAILHPGGYTDYLQFKESELARQKEEYRLQQEERARLEESAREKKLWAQQGAQQKAKDKDKMSLGARRDRAARASRRAKAIEKKIDQMEKIEPPKERSPLLIPLEPTEGVASHGVQLTDVVAGYPGSFTVGPLTLNISYGSRVGLIGVNGSGKTTLLKVITGDLGPLEGTVTTGPSLVFGNLMQAHENLPKRESLGEFLKESAGIETEQAYRLLVRFGFSSEDVGREIRELSPGERTRILLALFSARSVNVLVLDEPTNHLDIEAIGALEEVLQDYEGMVVLVSHDRYLLEQARLDQLFVIEDGRLKRTDFDSYVASASKKAEKLIRLL